jgi:SAM-dependent methyltransferase
VSPSVATPGRVQIDRRVVEPAEFSRLVAQILAGVDTNVLDLAGPRRRSRPAPYLDASHRAERLHELFSGVAPPGIVPGRGAKGRLATLVKTLTRRVTHWYVEPRFAGQEEIDAELARFATDAVLAIRRTHVELLELRQDLDIAQSDLRAARRLAAEQREEIASMAGDLRSMQKIRLDRGDIDSLRDQVAQVMARLGISSARGASFDYVAFEDRFRGASSALSAQQADYVTKFPPPDGRGRIVDIGCGRGEMLELLRDVGHRVVGVELDTNMLAVCQSKGLDVVSADGVSWLEQQRPNSMLGVFSAQVVEHLLTTELERFVAASLDALYAGGVMVIETINPRSLHALANHFFADLSHVRPVHPETLRFMCEQAGFAEVALMEISPHPAMAAIDRLGDDPADQSIKQLLTSVFGNQDYAVVATKR